MKEFGNGRKHISLWQNKCNIRQFKSWRHRWRYMYLFFIKFVRKLLLDYYILFRHKK